MNNRVSGALRLSLGLPLYILAVLVSWPIMVGAIAIYIVDTVWQIVTGRDGIPAENPVATVYGYYTGAFRWVAFGDKSTKAGRSANKWVR